TAYDAYELLARRDGRRLGVGASDSWITPAYEGLADEHSDASDPTPYFPFGQHPVVPPWLVDPMATGFRLRGPGVIEQFLEFTPSTADEWMNARGWRLEVKGLDAGSLVTVTVNSLKRTLVVGIPKGEQFTMPLSSTIPAAKIGHLSVASIIDANAMSIDDPVQSENDRRTRIERVVKGRNRQVTPQTAMTLVHAVQVPLLEPYVQADTLSVLRDLGQTTARFGGVVRVHRRSSGRIDLDLDWDEHLDTGPTGLSLSPGRAVLEPVDVPYPINGTATTTQGVSGVLQDFGDTKHRLVSVGVTATSRYADYFARERRGVTITSTALTLIGADDDGIQPFSERVVARLSGRVLERGTHYVMDYEAGTIKRTGAIANTLVHIRFVPLPLATSTTAAKRVPVHVLSTARPAPPVVRDVIPVFEDSPWLDYPPPPKTTGKRRIRDGRTLRIYFERPWFSSGADETIAVVLQRSQRAAADGQYTGVVSPSRANGTPRPSFQRLTSAWGRDPLVNGDPVTRGLTVASFPLAVETDAHPKWVMGLTPPGIDLPVIVVPHKVEFDEGTQLWFTDVSLRLGQAYRPFVRLALARYQPYSLPGAELSEIVTIDAAQLSPNRTITVSGSGTTRSVSFSGPAYTAANTGVPPTGFFFNFSEADTTVHRKPAPVVEVQVQRREVGGPYDSGDPNIGWIDVSNRTYTLTLNPIPAANGDQRFTATGIDVTVPDGSQARLVIREFEVDTRPLGESGNRRRLAFLDTYRI
ncbi:MAG: hypothetical protein ACO3AV_06590, partial [Ilumatobacteraceae bacterium]